MIESDETTQIQKNDFADSSSDGVFTNINVFSFVLPIMFVFQSCCYLSETKILRRSISYVNDSIVIRCDIWESKPSCSEKIILYVAPSRRSINELKQNEDSTGYVYYHV